MNGGVITLGSIHATTRGSYFNGWLIDGPKAVDPHTGRWVYLKYYAEPGPIPGDSSAIVGGEAS